MNDDWHLHCIRLGVLHETKPKHNQAGGKVDGIEPTTVDQKVGWQCIPVPWKVDCQKEFAHLSKQVPGVVDELVIVLSLLQEDGRLPVVDLPGLLRHLQFFFTTSTS